MLIMSGLPEAPDKVSPNTPVKFEVDCDREVIVRGTPVLPVNQEE